MSTVTRDNRNAGCGGRENKTKEEAQKKFASLDYHKDREQERVRTRVGKRRRSFPSLGKCSLDMVLLLRLGAF